MWESMTFFAPNGHPIPPGTPAYNNAVARQTAEAAYVEQQLRRQEDGRAEPQPPVIDVLRELFAPAPVREPQPVVPISHSRRLRRWARFCMGLAIFFTISAYGYAGMHQIGWTVATGVMTLAGVGAWGSLRDRADDAAEAGD
jgi:hypothetical protein